MAFSVAMRNLDTDLPRPKLQFVGSCRNKLDEERLQKLKDKAIQLKLEGDVEFHKNVMYRSVCYSIATHFHLYLNLMSNLENSIYKISRISLLVYFNS